MSNSTPPANECEVELNVVDPLSADLVTRTLTVSTSLSLRELRAIAERRFNLGAGYVFVIIGNEEVRPLDAADEARTLAGAVADKKLYFSPRGAPRANSPLESLLDEVYPGVPLSHLSEEQMRNLESIVALQEQLRADQEREWAARRAADLNAELEDQIAGALRSGDPQQLPALRERLKEVHDLKLLKNQIATTEYQASNPSVVRTRAASVPAGTGRPIARSGGSVPDDAGISLSQTAELQSILQKSQADAERASMELETAKLNAAKARIDAERNREAAQRALETDRLKALEDGLKRSEEVMKKVAVDAEKLTFVTDRLAPLNLDPFTEKFTQDQDRGHYLAALRSVGKFGGAATEYHTLMPEEKQELHERLGLLKGLVIDPTGDELFRVAFYDAVEYPEDDVATPVRVRRRDP